MAGLRMGFSVLSSSGLPANYNCGKEIVKTHLVEDSAFLTLEPLSLHLFQPIVIQNPAGLEGWPIPDGQSHPALQEHCSTRRDASGSNRARAEGLSTG